MYEESGRLLEFMDNLPFEKIEQERMIAVTSIDGDLIVDNLGREGENNKTGFTKEELQKILDHKSDIVLLHNHSSNDIPSGTDLLTYYKYDYIRMSLILCHDSNIYAIYYVSDKFPILYETLYKEYLQKVGNSDGTEKEAKRLATTAIYKYNESLSNSKKLFIVKKL